jgi:hypothetical protein
MFPCVPRCLAPTFAAALGLLAGPAGAAQIATEWNYEVSVQPGAPTPDATTRLIVRSASMFGSIGVGSGRDSGSITRASYSLRSRIEGAALLSAVSSDLNVIRQSDGRFVNGIALTMRYAEKRGASEESTTTTNLAARLYEFRKGKHLANTEPFKVAASDLLMAPYAFLGKPAPSGTAFLALSDGRHIRQITLAPRREQIQVGGKTVAATRLSGQTTAGTFDLWLRPEDSYPLRMRIGLGARYGAVIEQTAKGVPAELVRL